jgi:hypothetical protein
MQVQKRRIIDPIKTFELIASTDLLSQYERTRPLSGGCREETLNNHINVGALIQKEAFDPKKLNWTT